MSTSVARAPAIEIWSWIGRNEGSVVRTASPGARNVRVAMYSPSIPPFVSRTSKPSCPMSSRIASARPGMPALGGYKWNSRSSTLFRIASRIAGCVGRVFVFCDIHATSWRCSWANSKLSFDVMGGPDSRPGVRGGNDSYRFWSNAIPREGIRKAFGGGARWPLHDIGRETNRGVGRRPARGCRALGSLLPSPRGRRRGRPRRPRETDLQFEAFLSLRSRCRGVGPQGERFRRRRDPRRRRGARPDAPAQGSPLLRAVHE